MSDLECPYCGTYREQPDETNEPSVVHEAECPNCNKIFGFTLEYYPTYEEFELPCANGEPHNWVEIHGAPAEFWADKRECSYCNEQSTVEQIEKEKENA